MFDNCRETSAEAYRVISGSGLLSRRRFEVYELLYRFGDPCTASEAAVRLPHLRKNDVSSRLHELVVMGCVSEVGVRPCQVTGHRAILFAVNGNLPAKYRRPPSPRDVRVAQLQERIVALEAEVQRLQNVVNRSKQAPEFLSEALNSGDGVYRP